MQTIKRYYIGTNPARLVEMTPAYQRDTGFHGLVKGEDYDALALELGHSSHREALLQERLNVAENAPSVRELAEHRENVNSAQRLAQVRLDRVLDLKARNSRLFRWSCLGYLLVLGCLTYIFATGSI